MSQQDSPNAPKYGLSALAITSIVLLAAAAGVVGWLALGAKEYQDRFRSTIPIVILHLRAIDSPAGETGGPSTVAEPAPPLTEGDGGSKDAPQASERAESSPPAGQEKTASASITGAAPKSPGRDAPAKATPPGQAKPPAKTKVETATPEPPTPAKTPPKPPGAEPKAKAKATAKLEVPPAKAKARTEVATPEPPAPVEPSETAKSPARATAKPSTEGAAPEAAEVSKEDASKPPPGETVVRLRPTVAAPKAPSPVPGPPTALSNIITQRSALKPAPEPGLTEKSALGLLPVVGDDGRKPWLVYARAFDERDKRPRIALVIEGLGLSEASTQAAIQRLPGAVTLAFAPYARTLDQWIPLARAAGHEVLLSLPMEPDNFPANDPGPHTLLTSLAPAENLKRLRWVLSRTSGYVGVINMMGSRFTTSSRHLDPVLGELKRRGLMFVDSGASLRSVAAKRATTIGLARAINNRFIDVKASREAIDKRLSELERIARTSGHALGVGAPYPVTLERVGRWLRGFERKGLVLAPVSAVANKQPD